MWPPLTPQRGEFNPELPPLGGWGGFMALVFIEQMFNVTMSSYSACHFDPFDYAEPKAP